MRDKRIVSLPLSQNIKILRENKYMSVLNLIEIKGLR